ATSSTMSSAPTFGSASKRSRPSIRSSPRPLARADSKWWAPSTSCARARSRSSTPHPEDSGRNRSSPAARAGSAGASLSAATGRAFAHSEVGLGRPWRRAPMTDVTRILSAIEQGESESAEQLLPLVYDELRRLAVLKLGHESPGQTLQATALVHE